MLFLLAHGKGPVCRVPVFQHTAKVLAHGNLRVSGSGCSLCIDIGTNAFRVFEEASTSTIATSTFHQKKKTKAEKNERLVVRDCVHTRPMIDDREWKLNGIDRMHSNTTFGTYGVQVFMRRP